MLFSSLMYWQTKLMRTSYVVACLPSGRWDWLRASVRGKRTTDTFLCVAESLDFWECPYMENEISAMGDFLNTLTQYWCNSALEINKIWTSLKNKIRNKIENNILAFYKKKNVAFTLIKVHQIYLSIYFCIWQMLYLLFILPSTFYI